MTLFQKTQGGVPVPRPPIFARSHPLLAPYRPRSACPDLGWRLLPESRREARL